MSKVRGRFHLSGVGVAAVVLLLSGCGGSSSAPEAPEPGQLVDQIEIPGLVSENSGLQTATFYRPMPDGSTWLCLTTWSKGSASISTDCEPQPRVASPTGESPTGVPQ